MSKTNCPLCGSKHDETDLTAMRFERYKHLEHVYNCLPPYILDAISRGELVDSATRMKQEKEREQWNKEFARLMNEHKDNHKITIS